MARWKKIFVDYAQETTLHGFRYIFERNVLRRFVWLLLVLGAISMFIFLTIDRLLYLLIFPKAVNVEVSYVESLPFPTVTICNQNIFRQSSLQSLGLIDDFNDAFLDTNDDIKQTKGRCEDTMEPLGKVCMQPPSLWRNNTKVYREISMSVCHQLCLSTHKTTCSRTEYNNDLRICIITQNINFDKQIECIRVKGHVKKRCTVLPDILCDFEGGDQCPFIKRSQISPTLGWSIRKAGAIVPFDHTLNSSRGSYILMVPSKDKLATTWNLTTESYYNTTDMCIEFHLYAAVNPPTFFISTVAEDLLESKLYQSGNLTEYWTRVLLKLPQGNHRISLQAKRRAGHQSGIAVDDILIKPCNYFEYGGRRTKLGKEYAGNMSTSEDGQTCLPWADMLAVDVNGVRPLGAEPPTKNYCRNPFLLPEGPGCFTKEGYQACHIKYADCFDGYFRCTNGRCIPEAFTCDTIDDCGDWSDEIAPCREKFSINCSFTEEYKCGWFQDRAATGGLSWERHHGDINLFELPDGETRVSANMMELTSYHGDPGDRGWLFAPRHRFQQGCLQFYFMIKDETADNFPMALNVYAQYSQTVTLVDRQLLWRYAISGKDERWLLAEVPLFEGTYRLLFEGQISSSQTYIGITKVYFYAQNRSCTGVQVDGKVQQHESTMPIDIGSSFLYRWANSLHQDELNFQNENTGNGTDLDRGCVFPFLYLDKLRFSCIRTNTQGFPWCSTTYNYPVDGKWKACISNYATTWAIDKGGDVLEQCHFPFRYKGQVYDSCIDLETENEDSLKSSWCMLGPYTGRWGYCLKDCGGHFTSRRGILRSPRYIRETLYPYYTSCVYLITQPPEYKIKLTIYTFEYEGDTEMTDCSDDYIEIYDGADFVATKCGRNTTWTFTSKSNSVKIISYTDGALNERGFFISYDGLPGQELGIGGDTDISTSSGLEADFIVDQRINFNKKAKAAIMEIHADTASCLFLEIEASTSVNVFLTMHLSNVKIQSRELYNNAKGRVTKVAWEIPIGNYTLFAEALKRKDDTTSEISKFTCLNLQPSSCVESIFTLVEAKNDVSTDDSGNISLSNFYEMSGGDNYFYSKFENDKCKLVCNMKGGIYSHASALLGNINIAESSCLFIRYKFAISKRNPLFMNHKLIIMDFPYQSQNQKEINFREATTEADFVKGVGFINLLGKGHHYVKFTLMSTSDMIFEIEEVFWKTTECPTTDFTLTYTSETDESGGAPCQFPFYYNGNWHHKCIVTNDRKSPWCSPHRQHKGIEGSCVQETALIFTEGGNAKGKPCAFPFLHNGLENHECIRTNKSSRLWCATSHDYDKDGSWGYCVQVTGMIPKTSGGDARGAGCVFPFEHEGKVYHQCAYDEEQESYWCKTNKNKPNQFGYCQTGDSEGTSVTGTSTQTDLAHFTRQRIHLNVTTTSGNSCFFPFVYNGKVYHECTNTEFGTGAFWCSTTEFYSSDTWDYCRFDTSMIEATDGTVGHGVCKFPFEYQNKQFNYCIRDGQLDLWCKTTNGKWGFCLLGPYIALDGASTIQYKTGSTNTSGSFVRTTNNGICKFPFKAGGMMFNRCTIWNSKSKSFWCSLTEDFDIDKKWGICIFDSAMIRAMKINGETGYCNFPFFYGGVTYTQCIMDSVAPWCYMGNGGWGYCQIYENEFMQIDGLPQSWESTDERTEQTLYSFGNEKSSINLTQVYDEASAGLERMIHSCIWNGVKCDYSLVKEVLTDSGMCFTFNQPESSAMKTNKTGSQFGLRLVLNAEQYEYSQGPFTDVGFKIMLHDKDEVPLMRDLAFAVSPGIHALVGVRHSQFQSLGPPYGKCGAAELSSYATENYTFSRCHRHCETKAMLETCGCVDAYFPGNHPVCSLADYLSCVVPETYKSGIALDFCNCPDPCTRAVYNMDLSYASFSKHSLDVLIDDNERVILADHFLKASEIQQRVDPKTFIATSDLFKEVLYNFQDFIILGTDTSLAVVKKVQSALLALIEMITEDIIVSTEDILSKSMSSQVQWSQVQLFASNAVDDSITSFAYMVSVAKSKGNMFKSPLYRSIIEDNKIKLERTEQAFEWWNDEELDRSGQQMKDPWRPTTFNAGREKRNNCAFARSQFLQTIKLILDDVSTNISGSYDHAVLSRVLNEIVVQGNRIKMCLKEFPTVLVDIEQWVEKTKITIQDMEVDLFTHNTDVFEEYSSNLHGCLDRIFEQEELYNVNMTLKREMAYTLNSGLLTRCNDQLKDYSKNITSMLLHRLNTDIIHSQVNFYNLYRNYLLNLNRLQAYFIKDEIQRYAKSTKLWRKPIYLDEAITFAYEDHHIVWKAANDIESFLKSSDQNAIYHLLDDYIQILSKELTSLDRRIMKSESLLVVSMGRLSTAMESYLDSLKINADFIRTNFVKVDIYFAQLRYEEFQQMPKYEIANYLSEVGGYMGLLLGASALTLLEVLDLVVYNCCKKCHKSAKKKPSYDRNNETSAPEREHLKIDESRNRVTH